MAEIGSFTSRAHAEMAAGMLDARGIPARVLGDDAGGAVPHVALGMHGYRIGVPDDRADEATLLLTSHDTTGDAAPSGRRAAPAWITVGRLVLGVLVVAILAALLADGIGDVVRSS